MNPNNSRKNYIVQVIEIDNEADLHEVINMRRCGESNKICVDSKRQVLG